MRFPAEGTRDKEKGASCPRRRRESTAKAGKFDCIEQTSVGFNQRRVRQRKKVRVCVKELRRAPQPSTSVFPLSSAYPTAFRKLYELLETRAVIVLYCALPYTLTGALCKGTRVRFSSAHVTLSSSSLYSAQRLPASPPRAYCGDSAVLAASLGSIPFPVTRRRRRAAVGGPRFLLCVVRHRRGILGMCGYIASAPEVYGNATAATAFTFSHCSGCQELRH